MHALISLSSPPRLQSKWCVAGLPTCRAVSTRWGSQRGAAGPLLDILGEVCTYSERPVCTRGGVYIHTRGGLYPGRFVLGEVCTRGGLYSGRSVLGEVCMYSGRSVLRDVCNRGSLYSGGGGCTRGGLYSGISPLDCYLRRKAMQLVINRLSKLHKFDRRLDISDRCCAASHGPQYSIT